MTREEQGYQPICKGNQNNVIPPNTGSHVKMEKRITELGELLNSTLDENKEIYKKMAGLDTALEDCTESLTDARIKIKELEKENAELKDKLKNLESVAEVRLANWQKYEQENAELKAKIEKMKCCQNCKFEDIDCIEEPCSACTRCLGDIKRKGNSDKWELQENNNEQSRT